MLGDHHQVQLTQPPELVEEEILFPEKILEVRFNEAGSREFLVQWMHRSDSESSWMLSKEFVRLFPEFKLEDKLHLDGGSIDTIHQTYIRRKSTLPQLGSTEVEASEGNRVFDEEGKEEKDSISKRGFAVASDEV